VTPLRSAGMVCPMSTTTTSPAETLATACHRLADLEAELAGLPAATLAAQRATDVPTWMALNVRAEDLPGEILTASTAVLYAEIDDAWHEVEAAEPVEIDTAQVVAARTAAMAKLERDARSFLDPIANGHQVAAIAAARVDLGDAERAHREAVDTVGWALHRVDTAEGRLVELGAELPEDIDRGRRRPAITSSVSLLPAAFGSLEAEVEALDPGAIVVVLVAGTVPPRWLAHRLGSHLFEDPAEAARRTMEADEQRLIERLEGLQKAEDERIERGGEGLTRAFDATRHDFFATAGRVRPSERTNA